MVGFWVVLFVIGGMGAGEVFGRLSSNFSLPGQPGYETAKRITHTYGNGGQTAPSIVVVTVPAGQTVRGDQAALTQAFARVRHALPPVRVVD